MKNHERYSILSLGNRYFFLSTTGIMVAALYIFVLFSPHPNISFDDPANEARLNSKLHDHPPVKPLADVSIDVENAQELKNLLDAYHYKEPKEDRGSLTIPRVFISSMPRDLRTIKNESIQRNLFIQVMLPMILAVNEKILLQRSQLLRLEAKNQIGTPLSAQEERWLMAMAQKYKLETPDISELMIRIDVIPPSLALSQAIIETGWGTSFAIREKNSAFGMTISDKVKFYDNLESSVLGYIHNLNTNYAYRKMRHVRAQLRKKGASLCSLKLAETLVHYSELGSIYTKRLKILIQHHSLDTFDQAQLIEKKNDLWS